MGSVKDLEIIKEPTADEPGHAIFHFSDRYSVFDWGEMPINIDRKGESLALMGAYTFEKLEQNGIKTHYLGMEENDEIKKLEDLNNPSKKMHIKLVNVLEPEFQNGEYDYSKFQNPSVNNYLIPLEIIYRNRIPKGSSARRRYTPQELGLNMDEWPEKPISLNDPIVEASTKLEEQDRYIDDEEAERISGISLQEVFELTNECNRKITERAESLGMRHDDGKLEFLYVDGDIVVGDVAGTFDEARFTFDSVQVSKEVLRQAYKKEQPEWVREVKEAKEKSKEEGIKNWKKLVDKNPQPLGIEETVSEMYQAGANKYIGKDLFEVGALEEVVRDLKNFL